MTEPTDTKEAAHEPDLDALRDFETIPIDETREWRQLQWYLRGRADERSKVTAAPVEYPRVRGMCPDCYLNSLFLGEGGCVTCSCGECMDPAAADTLLSRAFVAPAQDAQAMTADIEALKAREVDLRKEAFAAAWYDGGQGTITGKLNAYADAIRATERSKVQCEIDELRALFDLQHDREVDR